VEQIKKGKILKHHHHTERESIDNTNNYCFFVYADIPVLLFVYSHFTNCGEGQTEGATWSATLQQGLIQR